MQDSTPRTVKAAQRKTLNDDWLKRVLRNRLSQLSAQELCSVDRPSSSSVSPATSASSSSGEASPVLEDMSNAVESSVASKPSEDVTSGKPRSSKEALEPEEPSNDGHGTGGSVGKASEDEDAEKPGSSQSTEELSNDGQEELFNDGQATEVIEPAPPAINLETVRYATVSSETNGAADKESVVVQAAEEMGQFASSSNVAPVDARPTPPAESAQPVHNEVVDVIEGPAEVIEYHDGPKTRSRSRMEAARLERNQVSSAPQGNNYEGRQEQDPPEPIQEPARYQVVLGDVTRYFAESGRRILEEGWKSFNLPSHILNQDELLEERLEEIQEEDDGPQPDAEQYQKSQPELRRSQRKRRKRTLSLPLEEPKRPRENCEFFQFIF
ncbi:hypothetical protein CRE_05980 [Caenorhabditis remanei]|uniref:Uncharacterized protein n=1 Tax=Caenorhabditis remanei TaxID=31234 RepID=E3MZD0_CAERE|nr:hypothetical protein CRE_05980 [Caenorhabditis remanei]